MPKVGEIRASSKRPPTLRQMVRLVRRKAEAVEVWRVPTFAEVKAAGKARREREDDLPF